MPLSKKKRATVAVTGVTGALGGRVATRLAAHKVPQLLIGRRPELLPELPEAQRRGPASYADAGDMRKALSGASTLVLVSGHRTGRRLEEHATVVQAAIAEGVDRILYVSLVGAGPTATYLNARDQWMTERYLAGTEIRHTVLRAGWYTSTPAALADEEFVVRGPASTGRAAFVTHEDIADVITAVVLDGDDRSEHDGATLDITGPDALTLDEAITRIAAPPAGRIASNPRRWTKPSPGGGDRASPGNRSRPGSRGTRRSRGARSPRSPTWSPDSPVHPRPRSRTRPGGPSRRPRAASVEGHVPDRPPYGRLTRAGDRRPPVPRRRTGRSCAPTTARDGSVS